MSQGVSAPDRVPSLFHPFLHPSTGDKSNEELLFLYGFAVQDNPHEVTHRGSFGLWLLLVLPPLLLLLLLMMLLWRGCCAPELPSHHATEPSSPPLLPFAQVLTVMCPLPPPAEWDELLQARLLLLQRRGLRPQLHLPAADLSRLGAGEDAKAATAKKAGRGASSDEVLASDLPDQVLETLEVFVMEPAQVAAGLEALDASAGGSASSSGSGSSAGSVAAGSRGGAKAEAEASGRRMALLTTLVRLLELKALEMEDPLEGEAACLLAWWDVPMWVAHRSLAASPSCC